jgi:hypothetical protein
MIGSPEFQLTARLDRDGTVKVKVTAYSRYGTTGREAGVVEEVTDEETLKKFESLAVKTIKSVQADLANKALIAAAEAVAHAAKREEVI